MRPPPRDPHALGAGPPLRVTIARILRPRGRVGEVAAELFTDFPQRLSSLREVLLSRGSADPAPMKMPVQRCWLHKGQAIFHFAGVDSINAAEKLRGLEVQIPFEQRIELPAGKYFVSDLVGCQVFEVKEGKDMNEVKEQENSIPGSFTSRTSFTSFTSSNSFTSLLGVVREVLTDTGTPLLVIESPRGEILVPFAEDICKHIDVQGRRIEIAAPDGLLDLNS